MKTLTPSPSDSPFKTIQDPEESVKSVFGHEFTLFPREGNGNPLHYSCLENPMDRGAWWAAVHGVTKSWTRLSDFTFTFNFHALEKEIATHSSVLAWRIPGTGEPGGQPSTGLHRVRHDWSDLAAAAASQFWTFWEPEKRSEWCMGGNMNLKFVTIPIHYVPFGQAVHLLCNSISTSMKQMQ